MSNINEIKIIGEKKAKRKNIELLANECLQNYQKKTELKFDNYEYGESLSKLMFENNSHFYFNPTEILSMGNFIEKNDRVLTVLSSGDFAIDSIYHGANDVVTFDINKYQYYVAMLKYLAINALSYDEFFSFFCDIRSEKYLSPEIYQKIYKISKKQTVHAFWNKIMEQRIKDLICINNDFVYQITKSNIGNKFSPTVYERVLEMQGMSITKVKCLILGANGLKTFNSYLESEQSYEETKKRLQHSNTSYIKSDLICLRNNLNRIKRIQGFDKIYLSNIPEYLIGYDFKKVVDEQLMPILKEDGSIIYCCQGVDIDVLTKTTLEEAKERDKNKIFISGNVNPLNKIKEAYDIITYQLLKDAYDISFDSIQGGCDLPDTYVRIKKR